MRDEEEEEVEVDGGGAKGREGGGLDGLRRRMVWGEYVLGTRGSQYPYNNTRVLV